MNECCSMSMVFGSVASDRGDGLCMPVVPGGDVVAKVCEGGGGEKNSGELERQVRHCSLLTRC